LIRGEKKVFRKKINLIGEVAVPADAMIDVDVVVKRLEEKIVEFEQLTEFYERNTKNKLTFLPVNDSTDYYEIENRTLPASNTKDDLRIATPQKDHLKRLLKNVTKDVIIKRISKDRPKQEAIKNSEPEHLVLSTIKESNDNLNAEAKSDPAKLIESLKKAKQEADDKVKTDHFCKICNKYFSKAYSLTRHNFLHTGIRPYTCPYCNHQFVQRSDLDRHASSVHGSYLKYHCHLCNKKFKTRGALKCHVVYHQVSKPLRCHIDGCTKKFRSRKMLRIHQIVAHLPKDKNYTCDYCDKKFVNWEYLKTHINAHIPGGSRFIPKNKLELKLHHNLLMSKRLKKV
jgi:uncharacterized Zn-finger protein